MQVVESVGGTFLIQETNPISLCGALTIITSGSDAGWISGSFCPSSSEFSCAVEATRLHLQMSLDVAVRFAGTLLVLLSCHLPELHEDGTAEIGELVVRGPASGMCVSWLSASGSPSLRFSSVEGGVEVRIHPRLASELAFRVLRNVGALSSRAQEGR